jgi:hypothetical protein
MLRWFSNHLLISADSPGPADFDEALAAGRAYTAFELLGTPTGFDFHHRDSQDAITEMGGDTTSGALILRCPVLSSASPKNRDAPEINALIFKDGQPWAKGCGEFNTDGPGAYRVRIDITPHHLRDFLGDEPDGWIHSYPWIYSNPIRVR